MSKKNRFTENGRAGPDGKREAASRHFTDEEIASMPSYTEKEMAELPKPWTKRGEMLPEDKAAIQGVVTHDRQASRIFVTGEALIEYLGDHATAFLLSVNDAYYENNAGGEPLFIQTLNGTVRMTRFDPMRVWRWIHPDALVELVQDEVNRLGVDMDPWKMDYFDFYQNMTEALKASHGGDIAVIKKGDYSPDCFYRGVYLSCLLLYGKPGYMDVPVAEHFALKEAVAFLRSADFIQLSEAEREKVKALREQYGGIQALTNPEVSLAVDLYRCYILGA